MCWLGGILNQLLRFLVNSGLRADYDNADDDAALVPAMRPEINAQPR